MTERSVYAVKIKKQRRVVTGRWYMMKDGHYKRLTEEDKLNVEYWRKVADLPEREPRSNGSET